MTAKLSILFSRGSLTSTSRRAIALQPPLNEERVAAYEREQGIVLPADYRAFITRVFGCGNWPFYGLRELGVPRVFLCGLAYDYCVRFTAEDAMREGFEAVVITDASRAIARARPSTSPTGAVTPFTPSSTHSPTPDSTRETHGTTPRPIASSIAMLVPSKSLTSTRPSARSSSTCT